MQSAARIPIGQMDTKNTESAPIEPDNVRFEIDPTAWVDDHGDYLFRYAIARLRCETTAEDLVQETLLSAIQALASYSGRASERTWLTGILKHKIIDHYRRSCREISFDASDTDLSEFDPLFERQDEFKDHWHDTLSPRIWKSSPEDALQQDEFFGVLQNCLRKLPDRVAAVFSLREMHDLDSDEVCQILGLSANNFWVMMHRARMSLRRCIEINWFIKVR